MWLIIVQGLAAFYLVGGALVIDAKDLPSKFIFKVFPMAIGLPLAFGVVARIMGWPI